ncbi:MAG: hypothetical protein NTY90_04510 [Candidatus Micrarchaeota archaeon]|nr:hypothetical protein [Candidatus Micrarchaeota archaeon]
MARIAIIANEHPNEVVAQHHARKVAEILREAGHDVVYYKHPFEKTALGIASKAKELGPNQVEERKKLVKVTKEIPRSLDLAQEVRKKAGADYAYNFHATPSIDAVFSNKKVGFLPESKVGIVEVPAVFTELKRGGKNAEAFFELLKETNAKEVRPLSAPARLSYYLKRTTPLKMNEEYLSPEISNEIAKEILAHVKESEALKHAPPKPLKKF